MHSRLETVRGAQFRESLSLGLRYYSPKPRLQQGRHGGEVPHLERGIDPVIPVLDDLHAIQDGQSPGNATTLRSAGHE
jgi:hypothetical protein